MTDIPAALKSWPSKLFVETTTRCNLRCAMCVKQSEGCGITEGMMSRQLFGKLAPVFPHLQVLMLNGVGEPLLHPDLEYFVASAKKLLPENARLGFQSNGILLTKERASSLVRAGVNTICLSLDSVSPETFARMREGGDIGHLDRALSALVEAKKRYPYSRLKIGIEFVLTRTNFRELPEVMRWVAAKGVSFVIVTHMLPYDREQQADALYDHNTKEAAKLYTQWQRLAAIRQIDLQRYPSIIWKYHRTAEEERVVQFVMEMKKLAEGSKISLNIEKLLNRDEQLVRDVKAVLEEAAEIAEEEEIELVRPGAEPEEMRACQFMESGSAFIAWDGNVHPCYFLWHRYNCHQLGWEQQVNPVVFGNVAEQSLESIWNDDVYRTFRRNAVAQDEYPFCLGCGLAPCNYVGESSFEQDCHINAQPCGSCLWPAGLFHCLT